MNSKEVKKEGLKYCPKCGDPIKEGSIFCESCGLDLSKREVKEKKAPKDGVKINPKMVGGIIIVAVVAIAVIFITSGGEEKEETPAPTTVPPATAAPTPIKVDLKDLVLDQNEMLPGYIIVVDKYLDENQVMHEWATEYNTQGGYWREFEDTDNEVYINNFCYLFSPSQIRPVFQHVEEHVEQWTEEATTFKDFSSVSSPEIGDDSFAYEYKYLSNNEWWNGHRLCFTKQNVMVLIIGLHNASWNDVFEVAKRAAEKIPNAPMILETPAPTTTAPPTTTPAPTTSPPTTTPTPTTTPPTTTPAPKHITLKGGMDEPLDDGKLYVVAWTVTKSYRGWQPGGYFVEVFIQNLTKDEILWKPKVMKVIDSSGKSHNCRVDVSFILTGTEEQLSIIEQVFESDEGFRLWLNFETGMYLPQTFILTNEYSDGSTTTWEIRLKL